MMTPADKLTPDEWWLLALAGLALAFTIGWIFFAVWFFSLLWRML